jgi:hypothetical protein
MPAAGNVDVGDALPDRRFMAEQAATRIQSLYRGHSARTLHRDRDDQVVTRQDPAELLEAANRQWKLQQEELNKPGFVAAITNVAIRLESSPPAVRKADWHPAAIVEGMSNLDILRSGNPELLAEGFPGGPSDKEIVTEILAKAERSRVKTLRAMKSKRGADAKPKSPKPRRRASTPKRDELRKLPTKRAAADDTASSESSSGSRSETEGVASARDTGARVSAQDAETAISGQIYAATE